MLIAVVLFISGLYTAYFWQSRHIVASSALIMTMSISLFSVTSGIGAEQVLITFGYLSAHQSGYLVGAYFNDRDGEN